MVARGTDEKARKGAGAGELWLEHGSGRGKNIETRRILAAVPGYRSTGRR